MPLLDLVVNYLESSPCGKAKLLASELDVKRSEVNSLLYSNPQIFCKNNEHKWSLTETYRIYNTDKVLNVNSDENKQETSLVVENIDLVERIKNALEKEPNLTPRNLSHLLDASRQLVTRTLHSYQDVFVKGTNNGWLIKTAEPANNFEPHVEPVRAAGAVTPDVKSIEFKEKDKPPQQSVIEATLDRNFLVLAPPGTGKTHTLIERLVYAISKADREVSAGEFLVLSFTRAAVTELRQRISKAIETGAPASLRYVQVKTFDAYSTWLLNDGGYDLVSKSFDERIKLLSKELSLTRLRQATNRIGRSRFLFVDEIQDLVGVRADMVFELVKRTLARKGSVTLLGDPHQSLNDYQINNNQTDSAEFLEKVQKHLRGGLERFELIESYRYETTRMKKLAADAKKILDSNYYSAKEKQKMLLSLIPRISKDKMAESFNRNEMNVLLCRSNGEVYQWLNWHKVQGNPCIINEGTGGRSWPAWIGFTLMHYQSKIISLEQLIERLERNNIFGYSGCKDEMIKLLVDEKLLRGKTLNLEELSYRLKYLAPATKRDNKEKKLVLSTIHKAKGLEYDNVIIIEPKLNKHKMNVVTEEEVRILYVAITRAKRSISLLPMNETPIGKRATKKKGGHLSFNDAGIKYLQVIGLEDFDLETLFINDKGVTDIPSLLYYLSIYKEKNRYFIGPSSISDADTLNYSLYLSSLGGPIRLCNVSKKMQCSLNAMAWGNHFGKDGAMLDLRENKSYQTIVHPMQSPQLTRHIGPSGIMVFPLICGFYELSKATGVA